MPGIIWIALIGLLAGLIARFLLPGPNNPQGFLVTMVIGIAGAFVATFIGQSMGWYRHDQGAGLIGATLGSIIVLFIWHRSWSSALSTIQASPMQTGLHRALNHLRS